MTAFAGPTMTGEEGIKPPRAGKRRGMNPLVQAVVTPLHHRENNMGTILIIILVLIVLGSLPTWGHSRSWGYAPSGLLGTILVIVIILVLMGRI